MQFTVFTKIINHEIPTIIVNEDLDTIAFLNMRQFNPGHVIVANKTRVETILELEDDRLTSRCESQLPAS